MAVLHWQGWSRRRGTVACSPTLRARYGGTPLLCQPLSTAVPIQCVWSSAFRKSTCASVTSELPISANVPEPLLRYRERRSHDRAWSTNNLRPTIPNDKLVASPLGNLFS